MKQLLKEFIPPIVLRGIKAIRPKPQQQRTFGSYAEAMAYCGKGYQDQELVEIVFRKTLNYRNNLEIGNFTPSQTLALLATWQMLQTSQSVTVLDFGGACGAHYFLIRSLLKHPLRWLVVETPAMAKRAKELETDELKFFDSLSTALASVDRVDVMFTSGTLQCIPDPLQTLDELLASQAGIVVLARLGLTLKQQVITNHQSNLSDNGPGQIQVERDRIVQYPFVFPSQQDIEAKLTRDYTIALTVPDSSGVFPVNDEPLVGIGYFAVKR